MKRLLIAAAAMTVFASQAVPASAAEGLPGATVRQDGGKSAVERRARMEERCKAEPEKCREMQARRKERHEQCKANPEKCRAEMQAKREERFKRVDANGDGRLTRDEAQKGMPMVARHFEQIDANKDGVVTMEELQAARKARAGQRKGPGTSLHPDRTA